MISTADTLLKVDWPRVAQHIKDGLDTGKMIYSQAKGTVYWASGSGTSGIVAHLPLVPVAPEELASAKQLLELGQAVKAGQAAAMTATVASTVAIAAVVVVATAYLANKIDKVKGTVDELSRAVDQQDQREYLKQIGEYLTAVKSADELLGSGAPADEVRQLAVQRIDRLAELRLKTQHYVSGLLKFAFVKGVDEKVYRRAVSFAIEMLDLVPAAIVVERDLCLVAGLPGIAKSRGQEPVAAFRETLADFQRSCNGEYRRLAAGNGGFGQVLQELREPLKGLFQSPAHMFLLEGLQRPMVGQLSASVSADAHDSTSPKSQASGAGG